MVSTGGGIVIAIFVLLIAAAVGWVVFTQLRARRLGLPAPSLASYLPWRKKENSYGPPRPAPGGIVGWFNDQVRKFKNRNNRSATGAYEGDTRGRRGFGPLDPDEAWDTRVGHEADAYGPYAYNEDDIEAGGAGAGASSYRMNVPQRTTSPPPQLSLGRGFGEHDDEDRGRRASRSPGSGPGGRNPFDDDAATSLRGVSPRPIDTDLTKQRGHGEPDSAGSSPTERRSVFRENM